jgi:hypothetical protein
MSGGPGRQRRGRDGGGQRSGSWPVGRPAGRGPADSGEGGYDRCTRAGENETEEKKIETKSNLKLEIEIYSNLIQSKQDFSKL